MDASIYASRRVALGRIIGDGAIALIPGASTVLRNRDTAYPFRQESNFYYLTGFAEPDALLVVKGGVFPHSMLFCAPKDPARELWDGARLGTEMAPAQLAIEEAFSNADREQARVRLECVLSERRLAYLPTQAERKTSMFGLQDLVDGKFCNDAVRDVDPIIANMRIFKSAEEIAIMREAAQISAHAHRAILSIVQCGMNERQIEAELTYRFRIAGGDIAHAYQPIVASGANACTLHYVANNQVITYGSLVLVDAGCEYKHFASDITRTFPASGRFTKAQRAVYDIVLEAQREAIFAAREGGRICDVHQAAVRTICRGLVRLSIVGDLRPEEVRESGVYKRFFPHGTSHWLGHDVHDVGNYEGAHASTGMRILRAGMVITVEPGIYIRPAPDVPEEYWNIGIRIEDDVLICPGGNEVLSRHAPKDPDEIQAIMQEARLRDGRHAVPHILK